ncbi:hypothetical protein D3C76_969250 [compost metagenome]
MGGHQHQAFAGIQWDSQGRVLCRGHQQGIDHGIAGQGDIAGGDTLAQQVVHGLLGGREMPAGQLAGDHPVGFLGERIAEVAGAQARFDMAKGNPQVETRQCSTHDRGRVALSQYHIRFLGLQYAVEFKQQA